MFLTLFFLNAVENTDQTSTYQPYMVSMVSNFKTKRSGVETH